MIFVTFQPLKNDRRKKYYKGNLKPIYDSFCEKPIFAIGYQGNDIDFITEIIFSSPQIGEKLVVFEADKYITLNKIRWHKYCFNFFAGMSDLMADRSILRNKVYDVTKKEPKYNAHYEYVVDEKDVKKLFEINLVDANRKLIYFDKDSKEFKKIIKKCKGIISPRIIEDAIYRYNDFLNAYIKDIFKIKSKQFFEEEDILEMTKLYSNAKERNEELDRNAYKTKLAYLRYTFISIIFPFILVAVLQKPNMVMAGPYAEDMIRIIYETKNKYAKVLHSLESSDPYEKRKDVDLICEKANKKLNTLYKHIGRLFYVLSSKEIKRRNEFYDLILKEKIYEKN